MKLINNTFVVSLRRRPERRAAFEQTAQSIELEDWRYVDGFDGAEMGLSTSIGKSYRTNIVVPMSAGEIGCYLTHLGIVRTALGMGQRTITVIEDDIRFKPGFAEAWKAFLRDVPNDWQLLHISVKQSRWGEYLPVTDRVERITGCWGSYFYVMREEAMNFFSAHADTMSLPVDALLVEIMRRFPSYGTVQELIELPDFPTDCGSAQHLAPSVDAPGDATIYEAITMSDQQPQRPGENVFHDWYKPGGVGSGIGSSPDYTAGFRRFLEEFMVRHDVHTVLDYGCGDWQWARFVGWGDRTYYGYDIVPALVERLKREHGASAAPRHFRVAGVDALPDQVDLVICKDVLQHLTNADALDLIAKLSARAKHVLWINDRATHNVDAERGGYRPLDLSAPPFSVPGHYVFDFQREHGKVVYHQTVVKMGADIPKIIHHVWPGTDPFRQEFVGFRESWMRHHPNWKMEFWRDSPPVKDQRVDDVLNDPRYSVVVKSDILRLHVLAVAGGLYVDTDFECLRPLDDLLASGGFHCGYEDDTFLCPSLMACPPGDPFVTLYLDRALERLAAVTPEEANRRPNEITGPYLLTELGVKAAITRYSRQVFYPVHVSELHRLHEVAPSTAYAKHYWNGTSEKGWCGSQMTEPAAPLLRFDLGGIGRGGERITVNLVADCDIKADITALDSFCADGTVTEFLLSHTLEHVPVEHYETFLRDMVRKLRPGGTICVIQTDAEAVMRQFTQGAISFRSMRSTLFTPPDRLVGNSHQAHRNCWSAVELAKDLQAVGLVTGLFDAGQWLMDMTDPFYPDDIKADWGKPIKNLGVLGRKP